MLEIQNLTKDYGDLLAVDDLSFRIEQGEFVTLLGPSGCGKSTTLHSIAGLTQPTAGEIYLRGEEVTDIPTEERNIGLVFQDSALFPHMTVGENIAYGLKMHGADQTTIEDAIPYYLELVHMEGYEDQKPNELSGGQQRRISLARALAYEPDILLLDEPLTGLDRVLREEMRYEIKRIQREIDVTTLFVTHDQQEALSMSDRIITLNDGQKEQEGTPRELYERPATPFVAEFVGKSTKFTGTIDPDDSRVVRTGHHTIYIDPERRSRIRQTAATDGHGSETTDAGEFESTAEIDDHAQSPRPGDEVALYIRPEDISLVDEDDDPANRFSGIVGQIANIGDHSELEVELDDGSTILAEIERFPDLTEGDTVTVGFDSDDVIVL